jgi:hypothetical protein
MKILRATNRRGEPDDSGCRLTFRERWSLAASLSWLRFKEYLAFDSLLFKRTLSVSAYLAACVLYDVRQVRAGYLLLSKLHRANLSALANRKAEQLARDAAEHARRGSDHRILSLYREHVERFAPTPRTARFFEDPARLLGSLAMVLKSPAGNEKGVVLLQYSYSFPLFVRRFDVEKVASLYHIVLEPDWSGYCDLNILSYCRFSFPVFVQAFEPRDASFISRLHSNLVVVPTVTPERTSTWSWSQGGADTRDITGSSRPSVGCGGRVINSGCSCSATRST